MDFLSSFSQSVLLCSYLDAKPAILVKPDCKILVEMKIKSRQTVHIVDLYE